MDDATRNQLEQDLAASLRTTARDLQLTEGKRLQLLQYVSRRVQELDMRVLQCQRDASAFLTQQRLTAAGSCLAQAAGVQDAARELRTVLDMLR